MFPLSRCWSGDKICIISKLRLVDTLFTPLPSWSSYDVSPVPGERVNSRNQFSVAVQCNTIAVAANKKFPEFEMLCCSSVDSSIDAEHLQAGLQYI